MQKTKIAIIGKGRFGAFLAQRIKRHQPNTDIKFFKRGDSLSKLGDFDTIIPTVPISELENVYKELSKHVSQDSLVIDVASVKIHPTKLMSKFLASKCRCIATHPLFGPDSAKNGLEGLNIMLHNVSESNKNFQNFKSKLKKLGLKVHEMSPEEHDKTMAMTQGYTHLIGRVGAKMQIKRTKLDTKGFTQTLEVQQYVINDSPRLFIDMYRYNPYAKKVLQDFQKAFLEVKKEIS